VDKIIEAQIRESEELLCKAMMNSDIGLLDQLLSSNLIFTNHLGHVLGKQDDLDAHGSGLLRISSISVIEQEIKLLKDTAIVSAKVDINGSYADAPANGTFRFTRVWNCVSENTWQVVAAHSSIIV